MTILADGLADFTADYLPAGGVQTFVAVTAVPEPSTLVLAIGGVLAALRGRLTSRSCGAAA